jgi:hypothetical protein
VPKKTCPCRSRYRPGAYQEIFGNIEIEQEAIGDASLAAFNDLISTAATPIVDFAQVCYLLDEKPDRVHVMVDSENIDMLLSSINHTLLGLQPSA